MENFAQTYVDKLKSGVEFEVKRMKGKHQEWLTKGKSTKGGTRTDDPNSKSIEDVMADCILRIGNDTDITKEKIKRMLSADYAYALLVLRFFSCDPYFSQRQAELKEYEERQLRLRKQAEDKAEEFSPEEFKSELPPHLFKFKYDYKAKGTNVKRSKDYEVEIYLSDFESRNYGFELLDYEAIFNKKAPELTQNLKLPITGKEIQWHLLTVEREYMYKHITKNADEVSSSTTLLMRNPVEMIPSSKENGTPTPLKFDLEEAEYLDIEEIRGAASKIEGDVDTRIIIEHPETKAEIPINIVNVISFFFPSGGL